MDENLRTQRTNPSFSLACYLHLRSLQLSLFATIIFPSFFRYLLIDVSLVCALLQGYNQQSLRYHCHGFFVILITRVMSLATLLACAQTRSRFICELIYYANYVSECAPYARVNGLTQSRVLIPS